MDVEIGEMASTVRLVEGEGALSREDMRRLVSELLARVREALAHDARAQAERRIDAGERD